MKKILVLLVAVMAFFSASAQTKSQPNWRGEIDVNVLFPVTNKGKNYKLNGKDLKDKIGTGIPADCFECTDTDFLIKKDRLVMSNGSLRASNDEFKAEVSDSTGNGHTRIQLTNREVSIYAESLGMSGSGILMDPDRIIMDSDLIQINGRDFAEWMEDIEDRLEQIESILDSLPPTSQPE